MLFFIVLDLMIIILFIVYLLLIMGDKDLILLDCVKYINYINIFINIKLVMFNIFFNKFCEGIIIYN